MIQVVKCLASGQVSEKVSTSWRLAIFLNSLRELLLSHIAVSFSHVIRDVNKEVDLLANAGVDGDLAHQWGPLENFEAEYWAQCCRQVATQGYEGGTQVARPIDVVAGGDRRHEHTMTSPHYDA